MNLLPYERFTIRTYLGQDEVHHRLENAIEPYKLMRWFSSSNKPYQGDISTGEFHVSRIITYRNSFLPRISGKIGYDLGQTTIDITMMLHPFVMVFMAIWMSGVGLGFIAALAQTVNSLLEAGHASDFAGSSALLGTGFMFVAGGAMTVGFFKLEASKSKRFFRELLEDIGTG